MITLLLGACGTEPEAPPTPAATPPPPALSAVVAGEHTWCRVSAGDLVECVGALGVTGRLAGDLEVDDRGVCGRAAGRVRCLRPLGVTDEPTPFVQVLRGPGAPCGRTPDGDVFCFRRTDAREADAELIAVPLPAPATMLASDGTRIYARTDDGRLFAFAPPAHGGGATTLVSEDVSHLAGDSWTRACWLAAGRLHCSPEVGAGPSAGTRLGVGTGVSCVASPEGVWCDGLPDGYALGREEVSSLAVGTGFACVVRGGEVSCAGQVPGAP